MRISDWSSDVCSSDLRDGECHLRYSARRQHVQALCRRGPRRGRQLQDEQGEENRQDERDEAEPDKAVGDGATVQFGDAARDRDQRQERSEEHTSELQSLMRISYAVFCLKKKNTNKCQRE